MIDIDSCYSDYGLFGEGGNEQFLYITVSSKGNEYPRKQKILYWARILFFENVDEQVDKETKCMLIQVAGSFSSRYQKLIPLSEVDMFL